MPDLSPIDLALVALVFIWSGFVRSGLGFGGAALALPLMLLIYDQPLFWLPVIATHLLIFSALTIYNRLDNVDWGYLKKAMLIMIIPKLAGVLGLINLPSIILVNIIYGITLVYALTYMFNYTFTSNNRYIDRILLVLGAYASGTSLIGAPLISAVFARHVVLTRLRDTLFVLWFVLVVLKMSTFIYFDINLQTKTVVYLLPFVALGHILGLKAHNYLIQEQGSRFKIVLGLVLVIICSYGLLTGMN